MQPTSVFTPTSFAGAGVSAPPVPVAAEQVASLPVAVSVTLPDAFPITLSEEQNARILARAKTFDLTKARQADIVAIGMESETGLGRALDGFLARLDKQNAPTLFKLLDGLQESVNKEDLGGLADQIIDAKPSLGDRVVGFFSKKKLQSAVDKAYEELARVASGKTKKLSDQLQAMEQQLRAEMNHLGEELRHMDAVKATYRASFVALAEDTAVAFTMLHKAQADFARLDNGTLDVQTRADYLDVLQSLESRAGSLDLGMTKLPSDQLVIRQLQNAGVSTLQELAITMTAQFNSIKQTLLSIHGALSVRNVQRLGERNANLNANLQQVRSKLMNEVVTEAATAPGRNRLAEAEQLKAVVADTAALYQLGENARSINQQKFKASRDTAAQIRQDLLKLGKQINPALTVASQTY